MHDAAAVINVGEIRSNVFCFAAQIGEFLGDVLSAVLLSTADDKSPRSSACRMDCNRLTDSLSASGNNDDLSVESWHVIFLGLKSSVGV